MIYSTDFRDSTILTFLRRKYIIQFTKTAKKTAAKKTTKKAAAKKEAEKKGKKA